MTWRGASEGHQAQINDSWFTRLSVSRSAGPRSTKLMKTNQIARVINPRSRHNDASNLKKQSKTRPTDIAQQKKKMNI